MKWMINNNDQYLAAAIYNDNIGQNIISPRRKKRSLEKVGVFWFVQYYFHSDNIPFGYSLENIRKLKKDTKLINGDIVFVVIRDSQPVSPY